MLNEIKMEIFFIFFLSFFLVRFVEEKRMQLEGKTEIYFLSLCNSCPFERLQEIKT